MKSSAGARRRRARVAEHARESVELELVGGQRVDLLLVVELQTVLDRAQEAVRARSTARRRGGRRSPRPPTRRARRAWSANPQLGVGPAVNELEELHRELDVADAAGPELQLTLAQPATRHFALRCALSWPERRAATRR